MLEVDDDVRRTIAGSKSLQNSSMLTSPDLSSSKESESGKVGGIGTLEVSSYWYYAESKLDNRTRMRAGRSCTKHDASGLSTTENDVQVIDRVCERHLQLISNHFAQLLLVDHA